MRYTIKRKRTKEVLKCIFMLMPFFELMVFELLVNEGYMVSSASAVMRVCSGLRILITVYFLFLRKNPWSRTAIGFSAFIIAENIVSVINGSLYIRYFIGSFTTVGFCLMCDCCIRKSYNNYIDACILLFGVLSLLNGVQCYVMPGGFFNAVYKENAVYLLGSKNTCFFFYVVFMYFLLYREALRRVRFKLSIFMVIVFLIGATFVSGAMNAFVMMVLVLLFYIILGTGWSIYKILNPKHLAMLIAVIAVFIISPGLRVLFEPLFRVIGRDSSITGRDVLWLQALSLFQHHPLVGNGILTGFTLETGVIANHAHSHFLDLLAKYGLVVFTCFVVTVVAVISKVVKNKKSFKRVLALDCVFLGLLLLHSIIDHLELFNFIIVLISVELLPPVDYHGAFGKPTPATWKDGQRVRIWNGHISQSVLQERSYDAIAS